MINKITTFYPKLILISICIFLLSADLSAAELKLLKQYQADQGEWVTEYQIMTNYSMEFSMNIPPNKHFPDELEKAVDYFKNIAGVQYLRIDHDNKILKVFSNEKSEYPASVNK